MTRRPVCVCALSSASWVSVGSAVTVVAFGDVYSPVSDWGGRYCFR